MEEAGRERTPIVHRPNKGVAREDRLPKALSDGYVQPWKIDLATELTDLYQAAQDIEVPDVSRLSDKGVTWAALLDQEPLFGYAKLLSIDIGQQRRVFEAKVEGNIDCAVQALIELYRDIQFGDPDLLIGSNADEDVVEVRRQAARALEQIAAIIGDLSTVPDVADVRHRLNAAFSTFAPNSIAYARAMKRFLIQSYNTLLSLLARSKTHLADHLDERLTCKEIEPAIGLLIAQSRLLQDAKRQMNEFTGRHTDFYYRDVLGMAPRGPASERVLLTTKARLSATLTEKDAIVANHPDGETREIFHPTGDVVLQPVSVSEILTTRYERSTILSPTAELGFVNTGRTGTHITGEGAPVLDRLFSPSNESMVDVGLAIESPLFEMAEGHRSIQVGLKLKRRQATDLDRLIDAYEDLSNIGEMSLFQSRKPDVELTPDLVIDDIFDALQHNDPYLSTLLKSSHSDLFDTFKSTFSAARLDAKIGADNASSSARARMVSSDCLFAYYEACARVARTEATLAVILGRLTVTLIIETPVDAPASPAFHRAVDTVFARPDTMTVSPDNLGAIARLRQFISGELRRLSKKSLFQFLLDDAFDIAIGSADTGILPSSVTVAPTANTGLAFKLDFAADKPPLNRGDDEPALCMTIKPSSKARCCPISIFDVFELHAVEIDTHVKGLKTFEGVSENGPVDPSNAFFPFGARPRDGGQLEISSHEMSSKPIHEVRLSAYWRDAPKYAQGVSSEDGSINPTSEPVGNIKVSAWYLAGRKWRSLTDSAVPMFNEGLELGTRVDRLVIEGSTGRGRSLRDDESMDGPAIAPSKRPVSRSQTSSGAIVLILECGSDPFGHERYPQALAAAMQPRLLRTAPQLPEQPRTPQITNLTIDYRARSTILIDAPGGGSADIPSNAEGRVRQITPFGEQEIYPNRMEVGAGLFPQRLGDGTLYVRISGERSTAPLSLAFDLEPDSHDRLAFLNEPVRWFYLSERGWRRLADADIVFDTTSGLMQTGLVRLNLPEDAVTHSSEMPGVGTWIAASSDHHLSSFPRLRSISSNGFLASRAPLDIDVPARPSGTLWSFEQTVTGAGEIAEIKTSEYRVTKESEGDFKTRVSELLRHRGQAYSPWDFERLVLEAFPAVWKVKCLSAHAANTPGHILVVVVPFASPQDDGVFLPRLFSTLKLNEIRAFLQDRASPFVSISVRNAAFEYVQVRADVSFQKSDQSVVQTTRLVQDISNKVSVWGRGTLVDGFDWSIDINELGAYMLGLDYVGSVARFSLLHLAADDDQNYRLVDTAVGMGEGSNTSAVIRASTPWSLALPTTDHPLVAKRQTRRARPVAAGIGDLAIGRMMVVQDHLSPQRRKE